MLRKHEQRESHAIAGAPSITVNTLKLVAFVLCGQALLLFVGMPNAAATDSPAEYEAEGDWAAALGAYLSVLEGARRMWNDLR